MTAEIRFRQLLEYWRDVVDPFNKEKEPTETLATAKFRQKVKEALEKYPKHHD